MRFADGRGVAPNNEAAALWLQRAAKQGLAPAQFRLGALYDEMVVEELSVLVMLMEILRRQDGRDDRHFGVQLNAHQPADDGFSDELVPVNATIDDKPGGNNSGIAPTIGEQQRV